MELNTEVNAGQMVVNNPPDRLLGHAGSISIGNTCMKTWQGSAKISLLSSRRFLAVHARQNEPDVWVFVDTLGLHLAPAMTSRLLALTRFCHFSKLTVRVLLPH